MNKVRSVGDISECLAPVHPETTNAEVYDRFSEDPDLMVLAVADTSGQVIGIIERNDFNLKMASQYGRALYSKKSVAGLMNAQPLTADFLTPLGDFALSTLRERPSDLLRGFVTTREGKYWGIGTSMSVLNSIAVDLQSSVNVQRSLTEDLVRASAEARRSEAFLNTIIQNIPALVVVKNAADSKIVLLNHAAESVLAVEAADVLGKTHHDLFSGERASLFDGYDRRALDSVGTVVFEEDIFATGLDDRVLQVKKTVLRSSDGKADVIITLGTDVTEQKRAEAQIVKLAHYDPLTGLANRALFNTEMDRALNRIQRQNRSLALLCLDLDRFKFVNDSFGHSAGDQLLVEVSARLRKCVRKNDLIARIGGDEFAIIQDITSANDAELLSTRIVEALKVPFQINSQRVEIGVSVGIAISPDNGIESSVLCARADLAMYRVKEQGKNGWCFFQPEMDEQVLKRLANEQELKTALAEGQFELHFQPLINLDTTQVVSFEALVRWRHPEKGLVSPGDFIPLAEETGLIVEIGEWVLKTACLTAASWPTDWRIAVNISPVQFGHTSLLCLVTEVLGQTGLAPQRLELEITEGVLLSDEKDNLATLQDLRKLGVRIAMDDFGTGYSSLSYLRKFPFDKIKIDQSFVRDLPHDEGALSIVRAITEMAQSLGVSITAEGVETAEQLNALRALNCKEAQGYLFGRPSPDVTFYLPNERRAKRGT